MNHHTFSVKKKKMFIVYKRWYFSAADFHKKNLGCAYLAHHKKTKKAGG
jgi:hypothetical protein